MMPDQVRAAADILDKLNDVSAVKLNSVGEGPIWVISSSSDGQTITAPLDTKSAVAAINAIELVLWDQFRKLGGKVPGDPEVEYKTVRP